MTKKRKFLEHYFRMYEMSELDGLKSIIKDESNELKRHLLLANIPLNYYDYNLEHILDKWSNDIANDEAIENYTLYLDNLELALENGTGLLFTGTHGIAKTTAAIVVLKTAIDQKFTSYFISMSDLAEFVTSGWKDYNLKIKYQYLVTNVDFLVVDDIGRNYHLQSNQHTQFFDKLFVTRCNQKKCTVLTSNYGLSSEGVIFTESLMTLLKASCIEIKLVGNDIREEKSKVLVDQLKNKKKTIKKKSGKKGHLVG
jgi:DNA replication protein DnaC